MSGGIAYVLNLDGSFTYFCNQDMVELTPAIGLDNQKYIKQQLINHIHYTNSTLALTILDQWYRFMPKFVKVLPLDYKRVMEQRRDHERAMNSDQIMADVSITTEITEVAMLEEAN